MPRTKKTTDKSQLSFVNIQDYLTTAPCVPKLREEVKAWRENDYKGATSTTEELLNFWFKTDHILPNGTSFKYHLAQREAIETLIYVYEVQKVKTRKELLERYAYNNKDLRLPPYDDFARFCTKMATGSGKTKVMSLAIVWQFFNAVKEDETQYAKNFLIIAPNVIVFDRLRSDFEGGKIFRTDPVFPPHFKLFWEMDFYVRGDGERASTDGALYLTNIQQFYEREDKSKKAEPSIMTAMLGTPPPTKKAETSDFAERIVKREGLLMILNDEAHHTHDEEGEWNKFIRGINQRKPLAAQLDFSATPRYSKGSLFAWTVSDYPLKQAILDGIVKAPIKGISQIEEAKSDLPEVKYQGFLVAGIERWKEYKEQLSELGKKPLLFIMMNDTKEADAVGAWMAEKYPEHFAGDKTLVIHTDNSGEISKTDLDKARKLAKEVDNDVSPVNAVVSVLMLREGWDVQNVTVVVGLRPYTSKANILPEQTIGRGLRLMFRHLNNIYKERVDIIGNKAFLEFVEDLEKLEDIKLESFKVGKDKLTIITIMPVAEKMDKDMGVPEISPLIARKKSLAQEITQINVMDWNTPVLPLKGKELDEIKSFIYEGRDILTDEKLFERKYEIPPAQTPEEVIGYYSRRIAENIKLPSSFKDIAPKVKEFFEKKAFGKIVNLSSDATIRAMSSKVAAFVVVNEFERVLRNLIIEKRIPELVTVSRMLSTTKPFPYSRPVLESGKTVFNLVACDNEFEKTFAQFLHNAEDIEAFAKLPEQFGFYIQYTDTLANLRNYYPDFIVKLTNGDLYLVETKGMEDLNVRMKDKAASYWCETATELTGNTWKYMKVSQKEVFERLRPDSFEDLMIVIKPL